MVLWERESLLLTFTKWKKLTRLSKRNAEATASRLGAHVTLRFFFQRWHENHVILKKELILDIGRKRKKISESLLRLHFDKWFGFSRSRGRRMRVIKKYWNDWLSHANHQIEERKLLAEVMTALQVTRKALLIRKWHSERLRRIKIQIDQRKKIKGCKNPRVIHLISIWVNCTPKLILMCFWKMVRDSVSS